MTVQVRPAQTGSVITLTGLRDVRPLAEDGSEPFDVTEAYDRHAGEIFGFALNSVRDRGTAEECVQETFLRAWRARSRFDPTRGGVRTWLFAIARNVVTDSYRRGARTPEPVDTDQLPEQASRASDPVERLAMVEALATLSPEHRQAVVAVHVLGLTYTELSESSGVPVATLRTRTYYGLRALRRHVEAGQEPGAGPGVDTSRTQGEGTR